MRFLLLTLFFVYVGHASAEPVFALVCPGQSAQAADVYEGRIAYQLEFPRATPSLTPQALLRDAFHAIRASSPKFADVLNARSVSLLAQFEARAAQRDWNFAPRAQAKMFAPPPSPDCRYVAVAAFRATGVHELYASWNELDAVGQAAVVTHLSLAETLKGANAASLRYLNASLNSSYTKHVELFQSLLELFEPR